MTIDLKEGWLKLSMIYSSGEERWEFSTEKPDGGEVFKSHKDGGFEYLSGQIKRIMYVEVSE